MSVWFSQGKTEASKRVMSFLIDADREISMSSARDQKAKNVDALKSRGDYIRKVRMHPALVHSLRNQKCTNAFLPDRFYSRAISF